MNDVSDEMKQFIDYLSGKTASSNLAARLEEKVKEAIEQRFWRKEYMTLKEMMKDEFENGFDTCLINLICKKLIKGKSEEAIADELEEDLEKVKQICEIAYKYAPDYDSEKILEELKNM